MQKKKIEIQWKSSKLMYQGSEGIRMCSKRVKSDKGLEFILFCGTHDICI